RPSTGGACRQTVSSLTPSQSSPPLSTPSYHCSPHRWSPGRPRGETQGSFTTCTRCCSLLFAKDKRHLPQQQLQQQQQQHQQQQHRQQQWDLHRELMQTATPEHQTPSSPLPPLLLLIPQLTTLPPTLSPPPPPSLPPLPLSPPPLNLSPLQSPTQAPSPPPPQPTFPKLARNPALDLVPPCLEAWPLAIPNVQARQPRGFGAGADVRGGGGGGGVMLGVIGSAERQRGKKAAAAAAAREAEARLQQLKAQATTFGECKATAAAQVYYRNSRGVEIFTKRWQPLDGVVKGIVVYCHGYGDTCTYHFDAVAVSMAQQQYLVYGMDYEGHGCSQGLHAYIPRFDTIIDDVVEFTDALRASPALSSLPVFLYGESMGGAVAIKTHWRRPDAFRGAVLLSPMCKIAEELMPPPMVVSAFLALSSIIPKVKMVPGKDISDIGMRDLANRKRAKDNPMSIRGPARVGTAVSLLRTTQEIGPRMKE
ncbi:unnamed protein product, partial [Closterium sp. NIES-54]